MRRKSITLFLALIVSIVGSVNAQNNLNDIKKDLNAPLYQDLNAVYKADLAKEEVAIGTGTLTTERYPIYAYFGYSYTQNIYLQSPDFVNAPPRLEIE